MMPVRWPVRSVLCGEIRPAGSHTRSNMHAREQQRQMDWPDVRVTTGIQSYDTPLPSVRPNPHIIHPKSLPHWSYSRSWRASVACGRRRARSAAASRRRRGGWRPCMLAAPIFMCLKNLGQ
ncbi:uncharacterized protein [Triticum aestivum]|uniref:Uncharacterized protein n=1 Tax=Triticum urartu TaxID=4572 RepID=A0A8R7P1X2_TRIUA|nr:uncharacterized protein LOC123049218 isoform X2 [Triticum aestivum]